VKRLFALTLVLVAAVSAGGAWAASKSLVPAFAQSEIATRVPLLPYVPSRLAAPSFTYWKWTHTGSALRIWFRNKAGQEIVFVAARSKAPCTAGRQKTFQLSGVKVYWGQTAAQQQAWRCVLDAKGNQVRLVATTPLSPAKFADVGLGTIVASGHRIK
jgi:hypothetical protein